MANATSEPGGLIIQTNRSLEETLGYSPGELLGWPGVKPWLDAGS